MTVTSRRSDVSSGIVRWSIVLYFGVRLGMGFMLFSGRDVVHVQHSLERKCPLCHRETTILGTSPIYGDFLLIAMYRHKVVGVFFSSYLMPKSSRTWRKSMGHH